MDKKISARKTLGSPVENSRNGQVFTSGFRVLLVSVFLLNAVSVSAQLSSSQARKLILKVAGINLPSSSVRIRNVNVDDAGTVLATADIETAFRLEEDPEGRLVVREVRVAPDRWESVANVAEALGLKAPPSRCTELTQLSRRMTVPGQRRARCVLAELIDVELPSDAVRIKSISSMGLPFASASSSIVVATVQLGFRFSNEGRSGWRTAAARSGNGSWFDLSQLEATLDNVKRRNALADLQTLAEALEKFRAARGFYVTADEQRVVVDHLSPQYLSRVIRVDPWNRPYGYQGEASRFTLRSAGPDGKQNTPDDIVLSHP
jgi:hypothetical protein